VAYASHGAGPPLIFVRGWISHLDAMWDDPEFRPFMEALGAHFTVTRYDLRGCGLSDRKPTNLELDDLVLDLHAQAA
jgi:pimeloyl-ACP methyl ester carboxylesterase